MQIFRFIKSWRNITDDYTGSIQCKKPLAETVEFINNYLAKGSKHTGANYHVGRYKVVSDKDYNTWREIIKEIQEVQATTGRVTRVLERMRFSVMHTFGIVHTIKVEIRATSSKICFEEFKQDFMAAVEDASGPVQTPPPAAEDLGDLSQKSLMELLDLFEKTVKKFGNEASRPTYDNVKKVRNEIGSHVDGMDIKARAPYNSSLSKIDTFLNAIDMQLANPAMAANIKNFAGTYTSQIQSEISQMISITE